MISKIIKNYKNSQIEFEIEYTGPETVHYIIDADAYVILSLDATEEDCLTLSLPDDFEKLCLIDNSYNIVSRTPNTIEFSNGKVCEIKNNSIEKQLVVEDNNLVVKDIEIRNREDYLLGIKNYKDQTVDQISNATDEDIIEKLETLLEEINFVIESTENDENFPFMLYAFNVV